MCSMHENTLSTLPGVASIEDCRGACNDQPECAFLTYFAADSFPFSETCFLFSACDEVLDCMACTTEVNSCPEEEEGLCSGPVEGILGDNIVEFLPDVESEAACLDACSANSNCSFYTHHSECDLSYPGACILLSHLEGSLLPCEHCRTGAKACSDACYFIGEGGEPVPSMVLTNTSTTTTINTVALGICQMNILVVGGGGAGNNGGGGSGELTWARWNVSGSSIVIARVGQHGQPTRVELQVPPSMASLVIAQAGPGGDGVGGFGGSGYSGGGGGDSDYGGDGGTNGRNGYGGFGSDSAGGGGSGVDVDQAPIVGVSIGAGIGGKAHGGLGGGGGGVLINGEGPEGNSGTGEGYGGGGVLGYDGHAGVVVLEFN